MERLGEAIARLRLRELLPAESQDSPAPEEPPCVICKGAGFVRHDVDIGHKDFGRAFICACRGDDVRERLGRRSNLGPLRDRTFGNFDPAGRGVLGQQARNQVKAAFDACRSYAEDLQPPWLVLAGPSGSGKTHLAAAIANRRIELGSEAFFTVVPDLLDHLRATFAPTSDITYDDLFESIRNAGLLILDDLGTHSGTPWAQEKLFQILNHRFNAGLPTVVTTNHEISELEPRLRARLEDRSISFRVTVRSWEDPVLSELLTTWPAGLTQQRFETFSNTGAHLTPEQQQGLHSVCLAAEEFAERPEGWLVLVGENGVGKTHLAAAIKNLRDQQDLPTLFMTVPDLLDYLRARYAPSSEVAYDRGFDVIRRAPLLVLDDYGAHSSTQWAEEKLFQLLNSRFNARLPTVITTNLPVDRESTHGPTQQQEMRIFARLRSEGFSRVFRLDAPRFRGGSRPRIRTGEEPARPRRSASR